MLPHPFSLATLGVADLVALAALGLASAILGWVIEHPPKRRPSVSVLMVAYRRAWMRQFVTRQPRIFDANVIDNLRQGTAFFASACLIALGGGLALIGNSEPLQGVAADLTIPLGGPALELKIALVLLFLADALLKFLWAHRLFGYCAILMAAVPNDPEDPTAYPMAEQAAGVNITAARGFNRAMRSIYFALGATGWLAGPYVLMAATALTIAMILRREFASDSRKIILSHPAP